MPYMYTKYNIGLTIDTSKINDETFDCQLSPSMMKRVKSSSRMLKKSQSTISLLKRDNSKDSHDLMRSTQ